MMIAASLPIYIIQILSMTYKRISVMCRMMLCLAESGDVGIVVHTQKVTKVKWKGHVKMLSQFFHQLMHKRSVLKGVLKFTLKQFQHVSV